MAEKHISAKIKSYFSAAANRQNLTSGEEIQTSFGKIAKWLGDLKTVAFTGSYNDLTNKPTIPTVNNGTLTIQQNGTTKATFTANQSGNSTANIDTTDKLSLNGGTMTGALTNTNRINVKSSNIDRDGDNPSATTSGSEIRFTDVNNLSLGGVYPQQETNGAMRSILYSRSGSVYNIIAPITDKDGTQRYQVSNPVNFRTAIGAAASTDLNNYLPLAGGTMTGDIDFNVTSSEKRLKTTSGKGKITINDGYLALWAADAYAAPQATSYAIVEMEYDSTTQTATISGTADKIDLYATELIFSGKGDSTARFKVKQNVANAKTEVYMLSPNGDNGIYADIRNTATILQVATSQYTGENVKIVFLPSRLYGGAGGGTSTTRNHFNFHSDCVGDSVGMVGAGGTSYAGVAQPGSTLDLWYETIRFNGKVMDMFMHSGQSHNAIWRGKYLGDTFTAAQKAAIADGSFDDLFVGDYWTINGVDWVIADIDYYYGFGNTECTTHHLVIVPRYQLLDAKMNATNTTTGGYLNSEMKTITLLCDSTTSGDTNTVYGMICAAFGENNILSHSMYLTNAIDSSGNVSNWDWVDSKVDLLTQCQVFGEKIWSSGVNDGFNTGIQNTQLAAFRLNHNFIINKSTSRAWYKLCDIWSATQFIGVNARGSAGALYASNSNGVRPHFCLKG